MFVHFGRSAAARGRDVGRRLVVARLNCSRITVNRSCKQRPISAVYSERPDIWL